MTGGSETDEAVRQAALGGMTALIAAGQTYRVAAAQYFGLNVADTHAITFLDVSGPLSQAQLSSFMGLTSAGTTGLVDRLEAAGIARRCPDPTDRRRHHVELTERAHHLIDHSGERLLAAFDDISIEQLALLGQVWFRVADGLRRQADRLRLEHDPWPGPPPTSYPDQTDLQ